MSDQAPERDPATPQRDPDRTAGLSKEPTTTGPASVGASPQQHPSQPDPDKEKTRRQQAQAQSDRL